MPLNTELDLENNKELQAPLDKRWGIPFNVRTYRAIIDDLNAINTAASSGGTKEFTKETFSYTDFQPNATNTDEIVINIPDGNHLIYVYAYESIDFTDGGAVNLGLSVSNSANSSSESRDGVMTFIVEGASSDTLTISMTTAGLPAPAFDDMTGGEITVYYHFEEITIA